MVRGTRGLGNIPAYAGKTHPCDHKHNPAAEHPRVCGENENMKTDMERLNGTSPRMRGKHSNMCSRIHSTRNIPAYAGKTAAQISAGDAAEEHPRVCGENAILKIV